MSVLHHGWIEYPERSKPRGMSDLTVFYDENGSVLIEWEDPADDFYGRNTRSVSFSGEEWEEIVRERIAYLRSVPSG